MGEVVPAFSVKNTHYATLHGDLRTASAIVLSYNHSSEKVKGVFLLYQHGSCTPLSKKSDLYTKATALVESTKDANGEYHIGESHHRGFFESDVYAVISQLESAMYNVTRTLQNNTSIESEEARRG